MATTSSNITTFAVLSDTKPPSINPYNQTFTWLDAAGTPFSVSMLDLISFNSENISLGLVYGAQIGIAALMLVTLFLLTAAPKRRSPVFALNVLALFLDLLRGVCMAVWLGSMFNNPYASFALDKSHVTNGDIANSVAGQVLHFLEVTTIMCSLVFQVRVIMSTTTPHQRTLVLITTLLVALLTVTVEISSMVVASRNMVNLSAPDSLTLQEKLADVASIMRLVAVAFFLIIFSCKLGIAIRQRYRLGQSKFGPMQMVFIGSLQSMVLPMIFTAAQYNRNVDLSSLSLTVLVCQLPLTALWASTSLQDPASSDQIRQPQPKRFLATSSSPSSEFSPRSAKKSYSSSTTSSRSPLPYSGHGMDGGNGLKTISSTTSRSFAMTTLGSMDVDVKMEERDMV